jgi:citrate synthase
MSEQDQTQTHVENWWRTEIIDVEPNRIRFRGYAIEDLIGRIGFCDMIWLMTRGELPSPEQARLFEAALMAGVDHGPQAPSIAIARMAVTCGVGLNNAMGSAVNVLGDVHGGAGEQAVAVYQALPLCAWTTARLSARQPLPRLMPFKQRPARICQALVIGSIPQTRAVRVFSVSSTKQRRKRS